MTGSERAGFLIFFLFSGAWVEHQSGQMPHICYCIGSGREMGYRSIDVTSRRSTLFLFFLSSLPCLLSSPSYFLHVQ